MTPQIVRFHTGGHAVYKMMIRGRKTSAWVDPDGNLIDCEQFKHNGHTVRVNKTSPLWLQIRQQARKILRAQGQP